MLERAFQADVAHQRFNRFGVNQVEQIPHGPQQVVPTECTTLNVLHCGEVIHKPQVLPQRSQLTALPPCPLVVRCSLPENDAPIG